MLGFRAVFVVDHNGQREFTEDFPSMPSAVSALPSSATAASFESSTRSSRGPLFWESCKLERKLVFELW